MRGFGVDEGDVGVEAPTRTRVEVIMLGLVVLLTSASPDGCGSFAHCPSVLVDH